MESPKRFQTTTSNPHKPGTAVLLPSASSSQHVVNRKLTATDGRLLEAFLRGQKRFLRQLSTRLSDGLRGVHPLSREEIRGSGSGLATRLREVQRQFQFILGQGEARHARCLASCRKSSPRRRRWRRPVKLFLQQKRDGPHESVSFAFSSCSNHPPSANETLSQWKSQKKSGRS